MRYLTHSLTALLVLALSATYSFAADEKKSSGTLLSFSAEASQAVANDLALATVFVEANDAKSAEVARKVNTAIAQALATAKRFADIKTRTGSTWTSPVYGKNGRKIESWQMRSELQLESRNIASLSELVGTLQADSLNVSQITLQVAPETRRKAEDQVTLAALSAFEAKSRNVAGNFKKRYRIVRINIDGGNAGPVYPMVRSAMMKAEAAPMPIEGGDSVISVNVSGEIELID